MSNIKDMIYALRKCAKEHENDVVCTGQIVTSSLCRDVADYLEADKWHYPSRGEYPTEGENLLCLVSNNFDDYRIGRLGTDRLWWTNDGVEDDIVCWQYIVPPKEEV